MKIGWKSANQTKRETCSRPRKQHTKWHGHHWLCSGSWAPDIVFSIRKNQWGKCFIYHEEDRPQQPPSVCFVTCHWPQRKTEKLQLAEIGNESSTGAAPLATGTKLGSCQQRRRKGGRRWWKATKGLSLTLLHWSGGWDESSPMRLTREGQKSLSEVLAMRAEGEEFLDDSQMYGLGDWDVSD